MMQEQMGFDPVVGWLACVEGPSRGKSYTIRGGINSIGRSDRMDITITGDMKLSAENHAKLSYSERNNRFNLIPGDGRNIIYLNGEEVYTDYPMPKIDRVAPAPALTKPLSQCKIAIVTSGGVVPQGNPDHIESSNATKWGKYSIAGMDHADKADFMTVHGGYDRAFVLEDPDLCIPVDVLRQMEREGKIGKLADYFCATTGTGTATNSDKRLVRRSHLC